MDEPEIVYGGRLKEELWEIFKNEEWSKPYTDMDELFRDLGLDDDEEDEEE